MPKLKQERLKHNSYSSAEEIIMWYDRNANHIRTYKCISQHALHLSEWKSQLHNIMSSIFQYTKVKLMKAK